MEFLTVLFIVLLILAAIVLKKTIVIIPQSGFSVRSISTASSVFASFPVSVRLRTIRSA